MRKFILIILPVFLFISCKLQPDSDRNYADKSKIYKLTLNPPKGSTYYFEVNNEYSLKMKVDDKKTENSNKSNFGTYYEISKDTAGNTMITLSYDKIHIRTKNGDNESDMDIANAANSINPVERMLGYLKDAKITAIVSPTGETKSVSGYKELGEKIIANFNPNDENAKQIARQQWEKTIGQGIVKKNMDDLFKIFPDSAVHIGDTWRVIYQQSNDIPLKIKTSYTLKDINDNIAIVESDGVIYSDSTATAFLSFNSATVDLKGKQQGQYEMDTKTGMLISCNIKANVEGIVEVMGREIPITIKTSLKMNGKKIN